MITPSIRDNVLALREGAALLPRLSSEHYLQRTPVCFNGSDGETCGT